MNRGIVAFRTSLVWMILSSAPGSASTLTEYSIGNPTAEEQYIVERINFTRMMPSQEADLLVASSDPDVTAAYVVWGVDLNMFEREMDAIVAVPPLSINPKLTTASRLHAADMLNNEYQGHQDTNGNDAGHRITTQGYVWNRWSENVYSYALSPLHCHAGFIVDWGRGTGGMQDPRAHRDGTVSAVVREIGVGHVVGTNGSVGPEVVDQVLATSQGSPAFVTGVAYYDANGNSAYDIGEGLANVVVTSPASNYFAQTADAGGYSLPVTANGATQVLFELKGETLGEKTVTISNLENTKADLKLSYPAPVIEGPVNPALNQPNIYTFRAVPGALSYDVKVSGIDSSAWTEGAEVGTLAKIIDGTGPEYPLSSDTYASDGARSFHLTFPDWIDQQLDLDREILLGKASSLEFDCRFRWVTDRSKLYAEMSLDDGETWRSVWERAGTSDTGDSDFSHYSIQLGDYAGETARFRFRFRHHNSAYIDVESYVGVYLDAISVTNGSEITDATTTTVSGDAEGFTLNPDKSGTYRMAVRPKVPAALPYGDSIEVSARSLPTVLLGEVKSTPTSVAIDFAVSNGAFSSMELEGSGGSTTGWAADPTAVLTDLGGGNYRFNTSVSPEAGRLFFRVSGTVD